LGGELREGVQNSQAFYAEEVVDVPGDQGQVVQEGSAGHQGVAQLDLLRLAEPDRFVED
jgi:hypothetical protein